MVKAMEADDIVGSGRVQVDLLRECADGRIRDRSPTTSACRWTSLRSFCRWASSATRTEPPPGRDEAPRNPGAFLCPDFRFAQLLPKRLLEGCARSAVPLVELVGRAGLEPATDGL